MNTKGAYLIKILTMVAGIIFFAHTAIPHHHHDQGICFGTDHFECNTENHGEDDEDHNHPFDSQRQTHQCCVSEFIPVSSLVLPRLSRVEDSADKNGPHASYSLLPEQILSKVQVRKTTAFFQKNKDPLGVSIHSSYGLRAPPQV